MEDGRDAKEGDISDRNWNGDDVDNKDDGDDGVDYEGDGDDGVDPKDTANLLSCLSASCQKLCHLELPGKSSQQNQGELKKTEG